MATPNDTYGRTAASVVLAVVLAAGLMIAPVGTAAAQSSGDDPIGDWLRSVDETQADEFDGLFDRIKQAAPQGTVNGLAVIDGQLDRVISNPLAV